METLYCLNANTGAVIWKFASGGPVYSTPAVIANDGIYFTSATPDSPTVPSTSSTLTPEPSSGSLASPAVAILSKRIYLRRHAIPNSGSGHGLPTRRRCYVYGINATTGTFIWRLQIATRTALALAQLRALCSTLKAWSTCQTISPLPVSTPQPAN